MPKVKVPRKSTHTDMTAMCDVAFLLLTFFILTSNFTQKEPVQIATPTSVSQIKIPEANILNILISDSGKVFLGIDNQEKRIELLKKMGEKYRIRFTPEECKRFSLITSFGVPVQSLKSYIALEADKRELKENLLGIPTDSLNNQYKDWVLYANQIYGKDDRGKDKLTIAIKADRSTPYKDMKSILKTMQEIHANRFNVITGLEEAPKDL